MHQIWPWLKKIDEVVRRFVYWIAFSGLVAAAMSWMASYITPIYQYGWGAVVFAGVGAACVITLVASCALVAWRYFNPLPDQPATPSEGQEEAPPQNDASELTEPWPDFKKWDQREKFELYEAACLWFDREPALPMPQNAQEKYQEWKRLILGGRLSVTGATTRNDVEISMKKETAINPHLIIYREVLEEVAKHDNVEPRFLFPYRRGEE